MIIFVIAVCPLNASVAIVVLPVNIISVAVTGPKLHTYVEGVTPSFVTIAAPLVSYISFSGSIVNDVIDVQ